MPYRLASNSNFGSKLTLVASLSSAIAFGQPQRPPARPEFEVASIKLSTAEGTFVGIDKSRNFKAQNAPLRRLIADAYGVQTFEIYDGPGWIDSDNYNILAKREVDLKDSRIEKESFEAMWADMLLRLQTLLEDRCSLKFHREHRELPVFALTAAKSGLRLQPSTCTATSPDDLPSPAKQRLPSPDFCGSLKGLRSGLNVITTGTGVGMQDLIHWLSVTTHRMVIDKTGYTEKFSFTLEWTPESPVTLPGAAGRDDTGGSAQPSSGPSIFTALQEHLGLKLESTKGPVEVLVIDHVAKPSEN